MCTGVCMHDNTFWSINQVSLVWLVIWGQLSHLNFLLLKFWWTSPWWVKFFVYQWRGGGEEMVDNNKRLMATASGGLSIPLRLKSLKWQKGPKQVKICKKWGGGARQDFHSSNPTSPSSLLTSFLDGIYCGGSLCNHKYWFQLPNLGKKHVPVSSEI